MAIISLQSHVEHALLFYDKGDVFFGIGRSTPWEDELYPPAPSLTDTLEEAIGYKRSESRFLVVPDSSGALMYKDTRWAIVNREDAEAMGARWVYLSCYLSYSELNTAASYRQIGVFTGMQTIEGLPESQSAFSPAEIANPGMLEVLDNRKPVYRDASQREQLVLIIEF